MILGLGVDACDNDRMRRVMERRGDRFVRRVLTDTEYEYCMRSRTPWERVAVRWAAKEATSKALGVPDGIGWHDVEIHHARGVPVLVFSGVAAEAAQVLGMRAAHLALTHERTLSIAVVIIEG